MRRCWRSSSPRTCVSGCRRSCTLCRGWRSGRRVWTETLGRRRAPEDPFAASPTRLRAGLLLHAIETDFMEPWRACPLWVGVRWSERSYPSLKVEVMAADTDEALAWIRTRSRSPLVGRADPDCRLECFFERRKVLTYVAAHRVKHFCGFCCRTHHDRSSETMKMRSLDDPHDPTRLDRDLRHCAAGRRCDSLVRWPAPSSYRPRCGCC